MDDDRKHGSSEERIQSMTQSDRKSRLTTKKSTFKDLDEKLRLEDFEKGEKFLSSSLIRRDLGLKKEDNDINEDSFFQEPKGLISMSPPTGSVYVKPQPDELQIQKQNTNQSVSGQIASKLFGILLFSAALVIYCFQTLMIKIVQKNNGISPSELLYYFSIVTCVLSYGTTKVYKEELTQLEPTSYKAVIGRFITGYFSDILLFVAYLYTSFSKCQCLFFTNTLMIPFFAKCMLGENIQKVDIVAIMISFVGMILIIQPFKGSSGEASSQDMSQDLIGVGLALLAAANGALSVIFNKQAASKVHHSKMTTYYTAANVVLSSIWSFIQERETYPTYDWVLVLYIIGIGVAFWAMQMLMTKSFSIITAGMAGILIYIAVPIGYILDYLFFHTQIGTLEIIGVCIIVGTNVVIGFLLYFGVIS